MNNIKYINNAENTIDFFPDVYQLGFNLSLYDLPPKQEDIVAKHLFFSNKRCNILVINQIKKILKEKGFKSTSYFTLNIFNKTRLCQVSKKDNMIIIYKS